MSASEHRKPCDIAAQPSSVCRQPHIELAPLREPWCMRVGLVRHLRTVTRCSLLAGLTLPILATGCRMFSPNKDSLAEEAAARRAIEGDVYRPEGRAAENRSKPQALFDRVTGRNKHDIPKARAEYALGDEYFNKAKDLEGEERADAFRAAAGKYKSAAANWRSSALEQDALLMMGEAYFFAEDFYRSEQAYARLVKEYPRNRYLDHVGSRRFEIADYWLKEDGFKHKPFYVVNFTNGRYPLNDTGGHGKRVLEKCAWMIQRVNIPMMPRCAWPWPVSKKAITKPQPIRSRICALRIPIANISSMHSSWNCKV